MPPFASPPEPACVASPWADVVFICNKCMKRQGRDDLRDDLKHALRKAGHRDLRVVACGCLDLCPKHAVTVALGSELASQPPLLRKIGEHDRVESVLDWLTAKP